MCPRGAIVHDTKGEAFQITLIVSLTDDIAILSLPVCKVTALMLYIFLNATMFMI